MEQLNIAIIIKLEPDFSEGNVSYNPDGTLNKAGFTIITFDTNC